MDPPETRYARSGDVRIAYQVVGNGPFDLVFVPGFVSNLDAFWETQYAQFFSRLAAFSRLILFDKRGTGLSDRDVGIATLEERMDDVRAVMDAARSEQAALLGVSEGGPMSLLFAATYPQRVQALVLFGSYAHSSYLLTAGEFNREIERVNRLWGTGEYLLGRYAPDTGSEETARPMSARLERACASPSAVIAIRRMNQEIDCRHVLPAIRVPTLVMHRVGDGVVGVEGGRYLAANIPGAKYIELPGVNHNFVLSGEHDMLDWVAGEVEEFLTGSRHEVEVDRVLATVMFTDIVDSTKRAAALGDREWRVILDRHDEIVRRQTLAVSRARGQTNGRRVSRDVRRAGAGGQVRLGDRRYDAAFGHRGARRAAHRRDRIEGRRYRRHRSQHRRARRGDGRTERDAGVEHSARSCRRLWVALRRPRITRDQRSARTGASL